MTEHCEADDGTPEAFSAEPRQGAAAGGAEQPLGRRHALRALLAGTVAAMGAALLGALRPDSADAITLNNGTSGWTSADGTATIECVNSGMGSGVYGVVGGTSNGAGVLGVGFFTGRGVWGQTGDAALAGVEGDNSNTGPGVSGTNT